MKRLLILILSLLIYCTNAAAFYSNAKITRSVQEIIEKIDPNINIGIAVHSKQRGKPIYMQNADRAFVPASTLKVLTAISSLIYLGENHHFETSFHYNPKKLIKGTLNGDLYLKFTGDPELTKEEMEHLARKLQKKGVQAITGKLYIDNTRFSGKPFGPGWMWDDQQSCYSAPLNAVILNRNCAVFSIETYKRKKFADISNNFGLHIINELRRSSDSGCGHEISVSKKNDYYFSGCISPGKHVIELAVNNPEQYAKTFLATLFKHHHIRIAKGIDFKPVPEKLAAVLMHRSPPLPELIKTMLKDSDNLIADSLLKTVGAQYFKRRGNWRNGVKAIRKIVKSKLGVSLSRSMIVDGAGLSRYNLIRPQQLVELLAKMQRYPKELKLLKKSLPIAGKDGTLKYRFQRSNAEIFAKTGTMNGVTSLAGYITTSNKDTLSFAILINGIVGKATKYKRLEEKLCQYFASL